MLQEKWADYGAKPTNRNFGFLGLYSFVWTALYMITETYEGLWFNNDDKYHHAMHLSIYFIALASYIYHLRLNSSLMHGRHMYLLHIKKVAVQFNFLN